jgi:hypothetical protein
MPQLHAGYKARLPTPAQGCSFTDISITTLAWTATVTVQNLNLLCAYACRLLVFRLWLEASPLNSCTPLPRHLCRRGHCVRSCDGTKLHTWPLRFHVGSFHGRASTQQ